MRITGWRLPMSHVSSTAISDFIQCPEAFRQKRILRYPDRMNQARFIGIVDHSTHAINFSQKINSGEDLTTEEMLTAYSLAWEHTLNHEGEPVWKEDPVKTYSRGEQMITLYHEQVSPNVMPIAVEQRFEEKINGLPIPVVGYIDLEEETVVRERKTAANRVSAPKPRWRFQGRVYQLATGKPVQWDVVTKQVTPQLVTADTVPAMLMPIQNKDTTVRMIRQTVEAMADIYDRYGPDNPWPTNGLFGEDWNCKQCSYQETCIAWA